MHLNNLHIDSDRMAKICADYDVSRLELFGNFVRGDASPASDVDVLVTFQPDAKIGLRFVALQQARIVVRTIRRSLDTTVGRAFAE